MSYIKQFQTNKGIGESALAFNPILKEKVKYEKFSAPLPEGYVVELDDKGNEVINIRSGVEILDNGDIAFRMYAKGANTVTVRAGTMNNPPVIELVDIGGGIFEGILPFNPDSVGPKSIDFYVDGVCVLNPYAPIWFHRNRACNYIEIPDPETAQYIGICDGVNHGTVRNEIYYSKALGQYLRCLVYTPYGYDTSGEDYPVLYLQHGSTENEGCWVYNGKVAYIMDNLISEGKCTPFIVVMNDGMVRAPERPNDVFHPVEEILTIDAIEFIESKYRVKGDKWHRALAGLSMGSRQSAYIGLKHPELYAYVGVFSGANIHTLDIEETPVLADNARFEKEYKLFYRNIGLQDHLYPTFCVDDDVCEKYGISQLGCYERVTYGSELHEWGCWRRAVRDFAQKLFKD